MSPAADECSESRTNLHPQNSQKGAKVTWKSDSRVTSALEHFFVERHELHRSASALQHCLDLKNTEGHAHVTHQSENTISRNPHCGITLRTSAIRSWICHNLERAPIGWTAHHTRFFLDQRHRESHKPAPRFVLCRVSGGIASTISSLIRATGRVRSENNYEFEKVSKCFVI